MGVLDRGGQHTCVGRASCHRGSGSCVWGLSLMLRLARGSGVLPLSDARLEGGGELTAAQGRGALASVGPLWLPAPKPLPASAACALVPNCGLWPTVQWRGDSSQGVL